MREYDVRGRLKSDPQRTVVYVPSGDGLFFSIHQVRTDTYYSQSNHPTHLRGVNVSTQKYGVLFTDTFFTEERLRCTCSMLFGVPWAELASDGGVLIVRMNKKAYPTRVRKLT